MLHPVFSAVMQTLARKNEWPLDKVNLTVDVTKKFKEEFNQPAREGAYVYGLYMEGRQTPSFVSSLLWGPQLLSVFFLYSCLVLPQVLDGTLRLA